MTFAIEFIFLHIKTTKMKKVLFALFAVVFSAAAFAQDGMRNTTLSLGINAGIPTSSPSIYSISFGADLQADFAVASATKITASAGYQNFSVKEKYGSGSSYMIPVMAGAKFSLGSDRLYGHAQLGAGFSDGSTAFAYAPSIGYYLTPKVDLAAKYLAFSFDGGTLGTVGLRLAYNF